ALVEKHDRRGGPAAPGLAHELRKREWPADASAFLGVRPHDVLERDQRHHAGADAGPVIAEDREDGRGIVARDRLAEGEVGREDRGALLEACLVLGEEALEYPLAL